MRLVLRPGAFAILASLCMTGCNPPQPAVELVTTSSPRHSLENDYIIPPSTGLGTRRQAITVGDGPNGEQVLFINYDGAQITRSDTTDDAPTNTSTIPNVVSVGSKVTVPAFDATPYLGTTWSTAQAVKDAITTQVKDWYAKYNVYIVTARPASGRYTMIMVGGQTTQVVTGQQDAVGVALLDCANDTVGAQNNVGFAFSGSEPPSGTSEAAKQQAALLVAQTIAHEAGHTFGLEHVTIANSNIVDIMSVAVDPNVQGFLTGSQTVTPAPSTCDSQNTENTDGRLLANLGTAPSGPTVPRPTVTWLAPRENDVMPRLFTAAVSVTTPSGSITKVDIVQAGVTDATWNAPPFQTMFQAPSSIPDGSQVRFTAIAYNSLGGKTSASVDFSISSSATQGPIPCLQAVDCATDYNCVNGFCALKPGACSPACLPAEVCMNGTCVDKNADMSTPIMMTMTPVPVGQACADSSECGTGGVCATAKGSNYCTQVCDPAAADSCPADYECVAVGADHYCGPKSHGCEMSRTASAPPLAAVFVSFLLLTFVRRRGATSRSRSRAPAPSRWAR